MSGRSTKKQIFDIAVKLFAQKGYDDVSIREIAYAVGIKESSIYNHYKSKMNILDDIFKKFKHTINNIHITKKQIEEYAKNGLAKDLLNKMIIIFKDDELEFIIYSYRIIYMQQFINEKARELTMVTTVERYQRSLQYTLNRLIYYKKIPKIDSKHFSIIWSEALLTRVIKLIHAYYAESDYNLARKKYMECANFLIKTAITGKI